MRKFFPSDEALVAACVEGEKDAWDAFVERFSKLIYWSIRKTLEDAGSAKKTGIVDDIFQSVFEKLLEKEELGRLRNLKSIAKFLSVMACHETLDKIRRLSVLDKNFFSMHSKISEGGPDSGNFVGDNLKDFSSDPSQKAASKETEALVDEVLNRLSVKERACVELHYLDGKTHREIAELMGLSQDTVSTVVRRTKEKLKTLFLEKGLSEGNI